MNKSLDVGSVDGSFSVSSSGSANYSMPIYTPPGKNGISPVMSVFYNSNVKNGLLGAGVSLSGISTIQRVADNFHFNGNVSPFGLVSSDQYEIDGQRLIHVSGTYGASNSTYITDIKNFTTIKAKDAGTNGITWWEVSAPDGTIYEYGHGTNSSSKLDNKSYIWYLNKVQDVFGNYMEFNYNKTSTGEVYLESVKYTGNDNISLNPYNEIRFLYQTREDKNFHYITYCSQQN